MADKDGVEIAIDLDDEHRKLLEMYAKNIDATVEEAARFLIAEGIVKAYADYYGPNTAPHRKAAEDLGVKIDV